MGKDDLYFNPHGTIPFPAGKTMPVTNWYTPSAFALPWVGVNPAGNDSAFWRSPIFDLRPDLRSSQGLKKQGVPVWNSYYARLYVQLFGLTATVTNTQNLVLEYREYANSTWGTVYSAQPTPAGVPPQGAYQAVVGVTTWLDATAEIMQGLAQPNSVLLVFEPVGSGYPVRYWQVELRFTLEGGIGPANLSLQGALY